jgi:hypothetical protein
MRHLSTSAGALVVAALLGTPAAAASPRPWVSPLGEPPQVARPFAPPVERWSAGHRGVDLVGTAGATVRAAGSGRVSFAGPLAGRGVVVVVHGALRTTYEPVVPSVRVGQKVVPGERIGRLSPGHDPGQPGRWLLHWGLLRGQTYLDPMSLLRGGPVRLLPRWHGPMATDEARIPVTAYTAPAGTAPAGASRRRPGNGSASRALTALTAVAAAGVAVGALASPDSSRSPRSGSSHTDGS